jgi:hypothetical protein
MKRWLCWLFLVVGVVLLENPHRLVSPPSYLYLQAVNQSVLHDNGFVSTWCRALQTACPTFTRNRAGPREFFAATQFGFLITDDDGPPWLDYRGPPGPYACHRGLVTSCKASGQAGSLRVEHFPAKFLAPEGKSKTRGFSTGFS